MNSLTIAAGLVTLAASILVFLIWKSDSNQDRNKFKK
jgi:hypothetical protein